MDRLYYFIRRICLIIPTWLGITLICFTLCLFIPGGPIEQKMAGAQGSIGGGDGGGGAANARGVSEKHRESLKKHYHFDEPIPTQFWIWLKDDRFGMTRASYQYEDSSAWELIKETFPISLTFGITSFILTYLVCIPLGIAKALRHGRFFDLSSSVVVFIGYAIPPFAFGMLLKLLFCGSVDQFWNIFPYFGFQSDNFDTLGPLSKFKDLFMHMFLPLLCYMIGHFAVLTILMKNSLLDQIGADYVRTVYAKGGSRRRAIWGHAVRNSLIPIATGFGSVLTVMFAGSVIIEQVFEIPGMGRLSLASIVARDYAVFMAILSLQSFLVLAGNVLSDFCYVAIDPRIDFNKS